MSDRKKYGSRQPSITYVDGQPRPFGKVLLERKVASRLSMKNLVIGEVLDIAASCRLIGGEEKGRWRLCLDEALVNAIVHGNNGDPRRFVRVVVMSGTSRWAVLIEDEGEGFRPDDIPKGGSLRSLYAESGRGILLMKEFADEVRYYRRGASVMLIKSVPGKNSKGTPPKPRAVRPGGGRKAKGKSDGPQGS